MRDLLIITPTRRPGNAQRLADAVRDTCTADTDLILGVDDDDGRFAQMALGDAVVVRGPRATPGVWTNRLAGRYARHYRALASLGDDHLPITHGWDTALLKAIGDMGGTGCAYGNDIGQGEFLPTAPVISSDAVTALGWMFYPGCDRFFCVAPETLVLTAGLRWVPAGKLGLGEELVGVDEYPLQPRAHRAYRRSVITAVDRRVTKRVTVELEDGRQVVVTPDHKWLAKRRWIGTRQDGGGRNEWRSSANLMPGDQILSPLRTWPDDASFEAGWLSGIFDGEGSLGRYEGPHRRTPLTVAQNPGLVLARIEAILGAWGIRYCRSDSRKCIRIVISSRSDAMELMGRLQATRLRSDLLWEGMSARPKTGGFATVRAVRPAKRGEVVLMRTSTGTFLAEGLVAHNCDNVWLDLFRDAGCLRYVPEVIVEHLHYTRGAAPHDELYEAARGSWPHDQAAYHEWQRSDTGLRADVGKIRALQVSAIQREGE